MRVAKFQIAIVSIAIASVLLASCAVVSTPTTVRPTAVSPIAIPPTRAPSPLSPVATPALSGTPRTLTVMTHDSFAASEDVLKSFEQANNVKLNILKSGDAGAALNKAILAKGNPLADLFYGVDNTFLSRALDADIFEPYVAKDAPAAFLLATVNRFPDKYLDYWKQLKANDVKVDDGWETAYYTDFSGSSGKGPRPLVVSYASSPPAEVVFAKTPLTDAPIGSVVGDGACFRQIEFVGVLKGAKNPDLARKFIDFMLSVQFQEDMPLQMFVFPVNPQAKLPEAFVKYAQVPQNPATLLPDDIAKNRDTWIQKWTETVLR